MKIFWVFFFTVCVLKSAYAECISVNGLAFEKIDFNKLLAISSGKNVAIVSTVRELPNSISQFRFFSEKLCDFGAEEKFHIDGKLFMVSDIQKFK